MMNLFDDQNNLTVNKDKIMSQLKTKMSNLLGCRKEIDM